MNVPDQALVGKVELKRSPVLLSTVVEQAVQTAERLVKEKGHTLEVAIPDGAITLDVDPTRMTQVVANLPADRDARRKRRGGEQGPRRGQRLHGDAPDGREHAGQRAHLQGAIGGWQESIDAVNSLIIDMVQPTAEVAKVIGGVAKGDLTQTMAIEIDGRPLKGDFLRTAKVVNTIVDQLSTFASEVTRVAREVGTEGELGGQAEVQGVAGTWKDLTDNVNFMASNLTGQVRNIADVTTAVAKGDLSRKITADARGEILEPGPGDRREPRHAGRGAARGEGAARAPARRGRAFSREAQGLVLCSRGQDPQKFDVAV